MIALAAPPNDIQTWRKIPLLLSGRWPRPLPPQRITRTALHTAMYVNDYGEMPRVAIDVEGTDTITAIGLHAVGAKRSLLIDWTSADAGHRIAIANILTGWFLLVPVVGHWVARDIAMLQAVGVRFDRIDDSGIAHAIAFPGQRHSLVAACGHLGQYGWTKGTPQHTQGDVLGALDVWYACDREIGPSKVVEGFELNARRHRYNWHQRVTLAAAIAQWRAGFECNYVPSVDPTYRTDASSDPAKEAA